MGDRLGSCVLAPPRLRRRPSSPPARVGPRRPGSLRFAVPAAQRRAPETGGAARSATRGGRDGEGGGETRGATGQGRLGEPKWPDLTSL